MTKYNENTFADLDSVEDADWVAYVNDYTENPELCTEALYCSFYPSRTKSISLENWPEMEIRIRRFQEIHRKWDQINAVLRTASRRRWAERRQKRVLAGELPEWRPLEEVQLKRLTEKACAEFNSRNGRTVFQRNNPEIG